MDCKHLEVRGNTTKYYYCRAKDRNIDTTECRDCMLKISCIPKEIETLFGKLR